MLQRSQLAFIQRKTLKEKKNQRTFHMILKQYIMLFHSLFSVKVIYHLKVELCRILQSTINKWNEFVCLILITLLA